MTYITRAETFHNRGDVLGKPDELPDCALLIEGEVAALLGTSRGVRANWRVQRRGPRFVRIGRSIRNPLGATKAFAEGRDRMERDACSVDSEPQDRQLETVLEPSAI